MTAKIYTFLFNFIKYFSLFVWLVSVDGSSLTSVNVLADGRRLANRYPLWAKFDQCVPRSQADGWGLAGVY